MRDKAVLAAFAADAVIVDDGIAAGSTLSAATAALRLRATDEIG